MIALLGVIFVDLIASRGVPWPIASLIILAMGVLMGLAHGLLITKKRMQPFVVTLCGLLIYRGVARFYTADATAGFPFGVRFEYLEYLTTGRTDIVGLLTGDTYTSIPIPHSFFFMLIVAAVMWVVLHRTVFGRHLYAVGKNEEAARFSGIRTDRVILAAYAICGVLAARILDLPCDVHALDPAEFAWQFLRTVRHCGRGSRRLFAARRRRLDRRCRPWGDSAAGASEPRQPAGHPVVAQLCGERIGDPDWRARRPGVCRLPRAPGKAAQARDGATSTKHFDDPPTGNEVLATRPVDRDS